MNVYFMRKPSQATRVLQPAGKSKPNRWRDGFALRLPPRRLLIVLWH